MRRVFFYAGFVVVAGTLPVFADPALVTDQSNYLDKQAALYTIMGAPPGSKIYWSSQVNGKNTGEGDPASNQGAYYGQVVGPDGTWHAYGNTWNTLPQGVWTKTAYFDDGSRATIHFNVETQYSSTRRTTPRSSSVPKFQTSIGVADWGGVLNGSSAPNLLQSAQDVQTLGAKNIMVALTPSYKADYPNTNLGSPTSLTQLAQTQPFQNVLGMPFQTVSIDIVPFINPNPTLATAQNLDQVTAEVHDLVVYLMKKYAGSGKTFILKNWEGDNLLHNSDPAKLVTADDTQKMIDWWNAIDAGVAAARQEMGDTGVTIKDAVEFNSLSNARQGKPSMLNDVIPYVKSDLVSYSSYDTINSPTTANLETSVKNDLEYIKDSPGMDGRPLMIGEWSVPDGFPDQTARINAIDKAFSEEGIPLANYWQMFDSIGEGATYGLLHSDGTPSPSYAAISNLLNTPNSLDTTTVKRPSSPSPLSSRVSRQESPVPSGSKSKEQYVISSQAPNVYATVNVAKSGSTAPASHSVTYVTAP